MIISFLLYVLSTTLTVLVSWLPNVNALPMINGYDIDGALVQGVGQAYNFANFVWPIRDVLLGAAFLWGFHGLMMFLKFILGHRAPTY